MILGTSLWAAAAVAAATVGEPPPTEPVYPALTPEIPCVTERCGSARLIDFTAILVDRDDSDRLAARFEMGKLGFFGFEWQQDARAIHFSRARWDLSVVDDDQATRFGGEYRSKRWRLGASVSKPESSLGGGTALEGKAALRLGPEWEFSIGAFDDSRDRPVLELPTRPISSVSLGVLWQPSPQLELETRLASTDLLTPGGTPLTSDSIGFDTTYQRGRWRLEARLLHDQVEGRFPRTEDTGQARVDFRLTPHLVVHAAAGSKEDQDFGNVELAGRAGLTYFARRHHFDREGRKAELTDRLVRHAYTLGLNERAVHTLEGRRQLRERLAISQVGPELAPALEELHRAQIADRIVPFAGIETAVDENQLDSSRTARYSGFVAVPFSPRPGTFALDERAVDFLRLSYDYVEREVSSGFTTYGYAITFEIAVNRELTLGFSLAEPPTSGIEAALACDPRRQLQAVVEYRFGI